MKINMKLTDIKIIKQLSQATVDMIPSGVSVDGFNNFYMDGARISIIDVLRQIEESFENAVELNIAIKKTNGGKPSPPPDSESENKEKTNG